MKVDALFEALARGDRVSRHDYDIDPVTVDDLIDTGILERDEEGYLVAGPLFRLHVNLGDDR